MDGFAEDLKSFGLPPAEIEKALADFGARAQPQGPLDIMAQNVRAVRLFEALQTQWRVTALSTMNMARLIRTGLDYTAIAPVAAMSGLKVKKSDFTRLRVMEITALNAWAEEAR